VSGTVPDRYPVTLDLAGRLVLVIGGAPAAEAKALSLTAYGADVVLVAARPGEAMRAAEADGSLTVWSRGYVRGDLEGAALVVCASGSHEIDEAVRAEAAGRGVLVESLDADGAAGSPQVTALFEEHAAADRPSDQGEGA
jgi:siroheme synthase-like protein